MKKLLASPRFPWIAAALAVVLFLPVLNVGLMMDDYLQRITYEGGLQVVPRPNRDLFRFVGPDRAEFARNLDFGAFGLIATFLSRAYAVAGVMVLVHIVLAPLLLPVRARTVGVLLHDYNLCRSSRRREERRRRCRWSISWKR